MVGTVSARRLGCVGCPQERGTATEIGWQGTAVDLQYGDNEESSADEILFCLVDCRDDCDLDTAPIRGTPQSQFGKPFAESDGIERSEAIVASLSTGP